jgi:hypothetical protein
MRKIRDLDDGLPAKAARHSFSVCLVKEVFPSEGGAGVRLLLAIVDSIVESDGTGYSGFMYNCAEVPAEESAGVYF